MLYYFPLTKTLYEIFKSGYSRIPVYEGSDVNDIIGLILAKDLIFVDAEV
jgi:CBS domain containing-hemolysin-like protein